ncbi:hypothetical protein L596_025361 [Steinernema carpocapsae]|uniref:Uncharacterized protein n=1 Tax=Steinernema carpocapsae TaxID=34508 RepID=A0A4U5M7L7_STECR|nr:hypothetical protein L596_025361 [Steinernema carpocapsae]
MTSQAENKWNMLLVSQVTAFLITILAIIVHIAYFFTSFHSHAPNSSFLSVVYAVGTIIASVSLYGIISHQHKFLKAFYYFTLVTFACTCFKLLGLSYYYIMAANDGDCVVFLTESHCGMSKFDTLLNKMASLGIHLTVLFVFNISTYFCWFNMERAAHCLPF